jgi:hypothetical protein
LFHCSISDLCAMPMGHRGVCRDAADGEVPGVPVLDPSRTDAEVREIDLRTVADTAAADPVAPGVLVDLDAEASEDAGRTRRARPGRARPGRGQGVDGDRR